MSSVSNDIFCVDLSLVYIISKKKKTMVWYGLYTQNLNEDPTSNVHWALALEVDQISKFVIGLED